ncbi:MAG: glycosyltransferase family 2 protein [Chloroflexota bacterium]
MKPSGFTNVIVTYNNRADVPDLLSDLQLHAPASQTILVDNASPDRTADLVQSRFPDVQLVRNAVNVGYARAVNQGFGLSESPQVFLLNPDIRVRSAAVFEALQRCLEREPRVAVAGPLQFKDDGKRLHLNFTWSYWTPQAFEVYVSHALGRPPRATGPLKVAFLNAGCLFIRRPAFEAVGRLNEKYFLYGEEPDLFLKLMRHGFECRLVPGVSVSHAREQSLRSVPSFQRLRHRLRGGLNIADAVIRGTANIMLDRLTGRRPA